MLKQKAFNIFPDLISDASNWLMMKVILSSTPNYVALLNALSQFVLPEDSQENQSNLIVNYSDTSQMFKWWTLVISTFIIDQYVSSQPLSFKNTQVFTAIQNILYGTCRKWEVWKDFKI